MLIEKFAGDHYVLKDKVATLVQKQQEFEGGDDPATCNFGKWAAQFKTQNQVIDGVLREMADSHRQFHGMVKQIKEMAKAGNAAEAAKGYEQMRSLLVTTFVGFDKIRAEIAKSSGLSQQATTQAFGGCANKQKEAQDVLDKIVALNKSATTEAVNLATQRLGQKRRRDADGAGDRSRGGDLPGRLPLARHYAAGQPHHRGPDGRRRAGRLRLRPGLRRLPVAGRRRHRAGGGSGRDLLQPGRDVLHDQAERRQRPAGQHPGRRGHARPPAPAPRPWAG